MSIVDVRVITVNRMNVYIFSFSLEYELDISFAHHLHHMFYHWSYVLC